MDWLVVAFVATEAVLIAVATAGRISSTADAGTGATFVIALPVPAPALARGAT